MLIHLFVLLAVPTAIGVIVIGWKRMNYVYSDKN